MESAITVKGQATIPKAIREHLRLKPGDRVKFFVHPDGSVVLLPKLRAAALRGIIKSRRLRLLLKLPPALRRARHVDDRARH
jgi:antitoxin PrlF